MSALIPLLLPGLALILLWWLLSGGAPGSWLVGLPAIAMSLWAVRRLAPPGCPWPSPVGLLRFMVFFIVESIRGGWDVARRTLAPNLRIDPGLNTYLMGLQRPESRLLFVYCVCLLPGTLAADLQHDHLQLHMLDVGMDADLELQRLERVVGHIFHEKLETR